MQEVCRPDVEDISDTCRDGLPGMSLTVVRFAEECAAYTYSSQWQISGIHVFMFTEWKVTI